MIEIDRHREGVGVRQGIGELVGHGDHRLPDLGPGDGDDLLAGIDHLSGLGVAAGDDAVEVGLELGEGEQVLCLAQRGAGARQVGLGGLAVALDQLELGLRRDVALGEVALAAFLGRGIGELRLGIGDRGLGAAHRQRLHGGIEGGQLLVLGDDRADIDEARHHAAEDAEAEVGLVARLDGAGERTQRVGGAHDRHDRQHRPHGRRLRLVVPAGGEAQQQSRGDPAPARRHRFCSPTSLRAISTFCPGRSICTPALTTTSPDARPVDTAMRSRV